MESNKRLLQNIGLISIGQFSSKLLSFLLVPLYTSVISTKEFGLFEIITTTVLLLIPILTLTMSEGVMRFCLDDGVDGIQVLDIGLFITFTGILFLLLCYPITLLFHGINQYYFWFLAFYITTAYHSILMQFLKGRDKVALYSICGIIGTVITIILNVVFLLILKWSIQGYMLANIFGHLSVILIIVFSQKIWFFPIRVQSLNKSLAKRMLAYTIPMIPNSISWWISNASDRYIMRMFFDVGVVGVYSVGYKIPSILSILSMIFMSAWHISAVQEFGSKNSALFFEKVFCKYFSINCILASGLIAVAKTLGLLLYRNDFFIAWKVSVILIFAFLLYSFSTFFSSIFISAKNTKTLFISTMVGAVFNIIFNFLLIPNYGMVGAAVATTGSYFVSMLYRMIDSQRIFKFKINYLTFVITLVIIGVQVITVYFDKDYSQFVGVIIFFTVLTINMSAILGKYN